MNATITVRLAAASDLDQLADLFDQYRQFYQCSPDVGAARAWLAENIEAGRSTIFAADNGSELLGFTQLYPALCSVDLVDYFVLYDLFVVGAARRQGIARALMNAASDWAKAQGLLGWILKQRGTTIRARRYTEIWDTNWMRSF